MNYKNIYNNLIKNTNSKHRIKLNKTDLNYVYYENHHIKPKCLRGNNDKNNLVLLTAKEHFIAHKLLTFIYSKNRKIALAFFYMTFNKRYDKHLSSRNYAYARELCHSIPVSIETKQKMKDFPRNKGKDNPMYGKKHKSETILKLKGAKSKEHKQKMSDARKNKSYEEFYGKKAQYMKLQRKQQTIGSGNPNSRKYIIHNIKLNKYWFCYGNLNKFCKKYHVSGRTFQLSRKNNIYINNWKCEPFDDKKHINFEIFK